MAFMLCHLNNIVYVLLNIDVVNTSTCPSIRVLYAEIRARYIFTQHPSPNVCQIVKPHGCLREMYFLIIL